MGELIATRKSLKAQKLKPGMFLWMDFFDRSYGKILRVNHGKRIRLKIQDGTIRIPTYGRWEFDEDPEVEPYTITRAPHSSVAIALFSWTER